MVHLLFTVKMLIFLQKEGHSKLLLVQYKKLTSNHGPQTFVAVRLKVILAGAVVTYIYEWGLGSRCVTRPRCLPLCAYSMYSGTSVD